MQLRMEDISIRILSEFHFNVLKILVGFSLVGVIQPRIHSSCYYCDSHHSISIGTAICPLTSHSCVTAIRSGDMIRGCADEKCVPLGFKFQDNYEIIECCHENLCNRWNLSNSQTTASTQTVYQAFDGTAVFLPMKVTPAEQKQVHQQKTQSTAPRGRTTTTKDQFTNNAKQSKDPQAITLGSSSTSRADPRRNQKLATHGKRVVVCDVEVLDLPRGLDSEVQLLPASNKAPPMLQADWMFIEATRSSSTRRVSMNICITIGIVASQFLLFYTQS